MALFLAVLGWFFAGIALCGAAYAVLAAFAAGRFMGAKTPLSASTPAVSILKPLHLSEPGLRENLESFIFQDYAGPVQIVFGVHDEDDPALAAVKDLQARYPKHDIAVVTDPSLCGANAKVSNLVNMLPAARHDLLVLADSDIMVPRHWLTSVTAALARPGVGLVTCLYTGRVPKGVGGLWPVMAAMGASYDFLPNVVVGTSLAAADACMGSTIALSRQVLEEVGSFRAFADFLADDYEIGRAVREKGYRLAIPPIAVRHAFSEPTLKDLFRHELRWTRTVRLVKPLGHLGTAVTFGFPFALLAAIFLGFNWAGTGLLLLTFLARVFLKHRIDAIFGSNAGPFWLLPLRDLLSFCVFVTSRFGDTVHWRGNRYGIEAGGVLSNREA